MRTQLENEGRVIIPDADLVLTNNFPVYVRAQESLASTGRRGRMAMHQGILFVQVDGEAPAVSAG